ncbi:unnamed protein product [Cuscuta europaea]|uniref:Uncharacterized protein n=1 Tax=Cuscuta europaea TaxID=41803 RepID=A0A9P1E319_CUSEU|nr:unnamed protein product [Cuscuta europaea]
MGRTKQTSKRQRDIIGADSSRAGQSGSHQPAAPYLPQFVDEAQRKKYDELMNMSVGQRLYPHLPTLGQAGIRDEVMQLLHRDWWQHLFFGIDEPTYKEITCEVLSSFKAPKTFDNVFLPVIKFRAFGESHIISVSDISTHLGFNTLLDVARFEGSILDIPPEVNRKDFGKSIAPGASDYKPQTAPSTALHPFQFQVVHALLSSTVSGRAELSGKVSATDLFCLWCMINERRSIFGALFARLFLRQANYRVKAIFAGPYITRLLKGMGYEDRFEGMTRIDSTHPMKKLPKIIPMRIQEQGAGAAEGELGGNEEEDDEHEHEHGEREMEHEMAHEVPYVPPPQGYVYPNTWEGMHQHQ